MDHDSNGNINCNWYARNNPQRLDKKTKKFRNQRTSEDPPDYSIFKIAQNTEKSPGDLRRLTVIQTSVKDYLLMLVWKTWRIKRKINFEEN